MVFPRLQTRNANKTIGVEKIHLLDPHPLLFQADDKFQKILSDPRIQVLVLNETFIIPQLESFFRKLFTEYICGYAGACDGGLVMTVQAAHRV